MLAAGLAVAQTPIAPAPATPAKPATATPSPQPPADKAVAPAAKVDAKPAAKSELRPAAKSDVGEGEDLEEIKKSKTAKAKAKKNEPTKKIPRSEQIARPGAPRERLPRFADAKPLPLDPLSQTEQRTFESMRKGVGRVDPALIDKAAKWHVYRLTEAGQGPNAAKLVDETAKAARSPSQKNEGQEFNVAFRRALVKRIPDALHASVLVEVNLLNLATMLLEGRDGGLPNGFRDPVALFVAVLADPNEPDPALYMALRGIERAEQLGVVQVDEERAAVDAILSRIRKGDVQPVLLERMVAALGAMGRAFQAAPARAEVAVFLAETASNPAADARLRLYAGLALANLKVAEIRGWNYELQGLIVAKTVRDLLAANFAAQKQQFWLASFASSRALDGSAEPLNKLSEIVLGLFRGAGGPQGADPQPLEQWISQHENLKNRAFTSQSGEIRMLKQATAEK